MPLINIPNSTYTNPSLNDAGAIMENFRYLEQLAGGGETDGPIQSVITSAGMIPNTLDTMQLARAILQIAIAGDYFKDVSTTANLITLKPYIDNMPPVDHYQECMLVRFIPHAQNTGPVTLQFAGLSPMQVVDSAGNQLPAGTLGNQEITLIYKGGAFVFSLASGANPATNALTSIQNLVLSAGLSYSSASTNQLVQAVALYVLGQTYNTTTSNPATNAYELTPFGNFVAPVQYFEGMVIRFRPPFTNTITSPTVRVGNLPRTQILASTGAFLSIGDLNTAADVVIRFSGSNFRLVSNTLGSLYLPTGPGVNAISNDPNLTNASTRALTTEFAVKTYVDNKVVAVKNFCPISGEVDTNNNPAFLVKINDNQIQVLAGEGDNPTYQDVTDPANGVAGEAKLGHPVSEAFDGDPQTYYESALFGSDASGHLAGLSSWIGQKSQVAPVARIRFLPVEAETAPTQVCFQYLENGDAILAQGYDISLDALMEEDGITPIEDPITHLPAVWKDIGMEISYIDPITMLPVTEIQPQIFAISPNAGEYITLNIPKYTTLPGTVNHIFRMRTVAANIPLVEDPNPPHDIIGDGLQIAEFAIFHTAPPAAPFVASLASGAVQILNESKYIDTFGEAPPSPNPQGNGHFLVFMDSSGSCFTWESNKYFEQPNTPIIPPPIDPNSPDQYLWTRVLNGIISTFSWNTINLTWDAYDYCKIGEYTKSGGVITSLISYAYLGTYDNEDLGNPGASGTVMINHNIGSDTNTMFYLDNVTPELGYVGGEIIRLDNTNVLIVLPSTDATNLTADNTDLTTDGTSLALVDATDTVTPDPHTHTVAGHTHTINPPAHTHTITGSVANSFSTTSDTILTGTLMYSNLVLPDKDTLTLTPITPANWNLRCKSTRLF